MTEKNTLKKSATLAAAGLVVAGALLAGCGGSLPVVVSGAIHLFKPLSPGA